MDANCILINKDLIPISSNEYKIKEEHKMFMNIMLRIFEEENIIEFYNTYLFQSIMWIIGQRPIPYA